MDVKNEAERRLRGQVRDFDAIWDRLMDLSQFADTYRKAEAKAGWVATLAFGVRCAAQMLDDGFLDDLSYQSRRRPRRQGYKKPSAQARHKVMLGHVEVQAVVQYAIRKGFTHQSSTGMTVIDKFDLIFHSRWIFTPDVDFAAIYARWNELHPDEPVLSESAFKKACQRALDELDESYYPYYRGLLMRIIAPDTAARADTLRARKRVLDREHFVHTVKWIRDMAKMVGQQSSDWTLIAAVYNKVENARLLTV